ncbi:MAG TPA: hypothetical protein OIL92_02385 [Oscillospiraceae bacterium]|nr:hypothetical protein [Oscillospiraceae bacterium]
MSENKFKVLSGDPPHTRRIIGFANKTLTSAKEVYCYRKKSRWKIC